MWAAHEEVVLLEHGEAVEWRHYTWCTRALDLGSAKLKLGSIGDAMLVRGA